MNNKVILTDCDGVLLDWEKSFHAWISKRGYELNDRFAHMDKMSDRFGMSREERKRNVMNFNESVDIGYLDAFRDSRWFVRLLHQRHGFDFICITSMGTNPYAKKLRQANLVRLFGRGTIRELICLELSASKEEVLAEYAMRYPAAPWIEDNPSNADAGIQAGLDAILLKHPHNAEYKGPAVLLEDWKDVHDYLVSH